MHLQGFLMSGILANTSRSARDAAINCISKQVYNVARTSCGSNPQDKSHSERQFEKTPSAMAYRSH